MMKRLGESYTRFWRDTAWRGAAHRRWFGFCAVCLAVYVAYVACLAGSRIFLSAADTVASLLWFVLVAAGVYCLLLFACARLARVAPKPAAAGNGRRFFWVSVGVSLFILGCVFAAEYPGGVTYDISNQWRQAQSGEYNNWHPVFHTLGIWLATRIWNSYPFVLLLQIVAFSLAMGALTLSARRLGASAWLLIALEALTVASPLVRSTLMEVGKDGAMSVGALLLIAQAIKMLATRGEWLRKPVNAACFGLLLAYTTMARHNAILFTLPLLLLAIGCYPKARKAALCSAGVLVLCVALVQGALYSALDVVYPKNTFEESVGIPMTILLNEREQSPEKLDADTDAFLRSLVDDEAFEATYQRDVYNSVKFTYARELIAKLPPQQMLAMTLSTMRADPRNAFETVNAVTDLVWDVTGQNEGVDGVSHSRELQELRYQNTWFNRLGKLAVAFMDGVYALAPVGWLFKNIGVQQLLLLLAALWALYRGGVSRLTLALPVLCYNLATMLVLCGADARFFHFFAASAPFALLALLYAPASDAEAPANL